jgi:fatty-acyl-CoA synthase
MCRVDDDHVDTGIDEVAVLGVAHEKSREIGVAMIVRRDGAAPRDEAGVLAHLDGRRSKYRRPRPIFLREALPKSGHGKITKKDAREMLPRRGEIALPATS